MKKTLHWYSRFLVLLALAMQANFVAAEVRIPNIFGDHMVLQQGQANSVWGSAGPGESVTVTIGKSGSISGQSVKTFAGSDGKWNVKLAPLAVGGPYEMTVQGSNQIKVVDILVGEVWVCSGQSNMQWSVNAGNDPDLEKLAANFPNLRMINFPQTGSQEPIWTHDRRWMVCDPVNVGSFSAVGYYFARQLHLTLGVPVGMVNNAWGGSACEAWINRDILKSEGKYSELLDRWTKDETEFKALSEKATLTVEEDAKLKGLAGRMGGNARPGNIYNGVLKSHLGYGIKGVIWYQGESNASRAYQYRDLFPLMIQSWRSEWAQGDFPFYWVQLADFKAEVAEPGESDWAELREAQTMTMDKLANTGEAVIVDIGEGKDIHPKNKVDVGRRLARWALTKDYGIKIAHQSPRFSRMTKDGNKLVLEFAHVGSGWRPFDVNEPIGFAVAGEDKKWVAAKAAILRDGRIEVWNEGVAAPVAVRYAWADNPVCNMFNQAGLPLTPFRSDDWPGVTFGKN